MSSLNYNFLSDNLKRGTMNKLGIRGWPGEAIAFGLPELDPLIFRLFFRYSIPSISILCYNNKKKTLFDIQAKTIFVHKHNMTTS